MLELLIGGGLGVPSDGAEELIYGTTLHGYYGEVQATPKLWLATSIRTSRIKNK